VKVVILCGGQGTRMREETEFRPKPLVEIGGRPILWHIMKTYAAAGFREFILCLGYKGNMIKEYFLNYEAMNNDFTVCLGEKHQIRYHGAHEEQDFHVTLADTGADSMTGGRVKRVQKYIGNEPFMLTYGDGVADVNLSALLKFHQDHGKVATVTTVRPVSRWGILELTKNFAVRQFVEKPQIDGWASAGFFVLQPEIFDLLPNDQCILEQEPLIKLADRQELMAYQHEGFFFAMDTYREFQYLNELWHNGKAPWKTWR
jgi:glucose-1-phosphate cytidylyltransferase